MHRHICRLIRPQRLRADAGFSLIDTLVTLAIVGIIAGVALPEVVDVASQMKLGQGARDVEREMQSARLKAVTSGRPIRIHFNCPAATEYRLTELIGTASAPVAADTAADRCSPATYPYPPADNNPMTRPNNDGPVRYLPTRVTFGTTKTLEFWPDGSAHMSDGTGTSPWPVIPPAGTDISLTKASAVKHITVNGLGKITLVE
jgi:type II secretory pathway pseudopilin PulG